MQRCIGCGNALTQDGWTYCPWCGRLLIIADPPPYDPGPDNRPSYASAEIWQ